MLFLNFRPELAQYAYLGNMLDYLDKKKKQSYF